MRVCSVELRVLDVKAGVYEEAYVVPFLCHRLKELK